MHTNAIKNQPSTRRAGEKSTHVQSAYKKPPKQNAAMTIRMTNCTIIARSESTITLFLSVTKASLQSRQFGGWGEDV